MFLPIWERIVSGSYTSLPAVLTGYTRMSVMNEDYPVIIPSQLGLCNGILYEQVSESDLALIDQFEGEEYKRITALVSLQNLGRPATVNAEIYCLNPDYSLIISPTFWDEENFKKNSIEKFIRKYHL